MGDAGRVPDRIRSFVFDIDGCLAVGGVPIDGALATLQELERRQHPFVLFTNDSILSSGEWRAKAAAMGFDFPDLRVITAGEILAQLAADRYRGGAALLLGTESVARELAARGVQVVEPDRAGEADVVLVARDPSVGYEQLTAAMRALQAGAGFLTSSMARSIPARGGPVLGTGAVTKALAFAARRTPVVAGKPSALAARVCLQLAGFDRARTAFVGDDAELDVATARLGGALSILVLTGTTRREQVPSLPPRLRPDVVLDSVADLPSLLPGSPLARAAAVGGGR